MTEFKHTPGPWDGKDIFFRSVNGFSFSFPFDDNDEASANCRLIAAAPEMLDILMELFESAEYWSEYDVPIGIVDNIKNTIEHATGLTITEAIAAYNEVHNGAID